MTHTTIDVHTASGLRALWRVENGSEKLIANAIGKGPVKCTAFAAAEQTSIMLATPADAMDWLFAESAARVGTKPGIRIGGGSEVGEK